jgi:O-antigen ligase
MDRAFWFTLALYVVVLPISGTIALRNICLLILVALTLWQVGHRRLRLDFPLARPWGIYAFVAIVSLTYAVDSAYSFSEIKSEFVYPLIVLVIAASWIRNPGRFNRLVWLLVAGNVFFVIGSVRSAWPYLAPVISGRENALWAFKTWGTWGAGAWGNGVGDTAATIIAVLPIFIVLTLTYHAAGKRRVSLWLWGLMLANVVALILTLNRQAWICIAASIAVIVLLSDRARWTRRQMLGTALVGMVLVSIAYAQFRTRTQSVEVPQDSMLEAPVSIDSGNQARDISTSGSPTVLANIHSGVASDPRIELWSFCLARMAEHPWDGGGFGREAFKRSYPEFVKAHPGQQLWHAHNMVLNKGIEMGVPGIAGFLLLWGVTVAAVSGGLRHPQMRHWAIALLAMMAAVFLRSMTDDFFIRNHAQMFWLVLGAFLGCTRQSSIGPRED